MNVSEILSELEIPTAPEGHHHRTKGWEQIDCPHCSPNSHRWRLGIPTNNKRVAVCWTCGTHPLARTLSLISSRSIEEINNLLLDFGGGDKKETIFERELILPKGAGPLLPQHREFLDSRGFDPDEIVGTWGIMGIGVAPKLSWRILIPITEKGKIVNWTTRSVSQNASRRYRNAERSQSRLDRSECLYGADNARKGHAVIVTEGPLDAWAIGIGGVSTLGVGYSRGQLLKILEFPVRVVCFDNEVEAQRRARRLCSELERFRGEVYNVVMETGKDPSRANKEEVEELKNRFLK